MQIDVLRTDCNRCGIDHPRGSQFCPDYWPGRTLGERYRLEKLIGSGGMGKIYSGRDTRTRRSVAVKIVMPNGNPDGNMLHRLRQEIEILGELADIPGIVQILDQGEASPDFPFFVMELLSGYSFRQLFQHEARTLHRVCSLLANVADIIEAAHRRKVFHRDLKPDNLFLVQPGALEQVRVLDFGISKARFYSDEQGNTELSQHLTSAGAFLGTAQYASPEQLSDFKNVDARADIYSLGAILFVLLTGQHAVQAQDTHRILINVSKGEIERHPAVLRPDIPEWLNLLVAQCLAYEKHRRPATAGEVAARLREGIKQLPQLETDGTLFAPISASRITPVQLQAPLGREVSLTLEDQGSGVSAFTPPPSELSALETKENSIHQRRLEATVADEATLPQREVTGVTEHERTRPALISLLGQGPGGSSMKRGAMTSRPTEGTVTHVAVAGQFEPVAPALVNQSATVQELSLQTAIPAPVPPAPIPNPVTEKAGPTEEAAVTLPPTAPLPTRLSQRKRPSRLAAGVGVGVALAAAAWFSGTGNQHSSVPPAPTSAPNTRGAQGQVRLSAITFQMGSTREEATGAFQWCQQLTTGCREEFYLREMPVREVTVDIFWMDRLEVSVADYVQWIQSLPKVTRQGDEILGAGGEVLATLGAGEPLLWQGNGPVIASGMARLPITGISWESAHRYCQAQGGDLPSEAQWERAARGPERRPFPWGGAEPACSTAVVWRAAGGRCAHLGTGPAPVGSSSLDQTPEGIRDMGGNVSEWVLDAFEDPYPSCSVPCRNPVNLSGLNQESADQNKSQTPGVIRVARGGNLKLPFESARASGRLRIPAHTAPDNVGFRCVRPEG